VLALPNRGKALQQDSMGSANKGIQLETLNKEREGEHKKLTDTDGRLGMRSPERDRRMRDDAQDLSRICKQV
jgi:hypothetical protein